MVFLDVRRLAALDMYGTRGSDRRRRVIRQEFLVGAVGCLAVGLASLLFGHGWGRVLGAWLVFLGVNYVPLAVSARSLSRPGALEAELAGVDLDRELRRAGIRQLWIMVPLAVVLAAALDRAGAPPRR